MFFGAEFDASAGTNKLPADAVRYYIDTLAPTPIICAAASGSTGRSPRQRRPERGAQDAASGHARPRDRRRGKRRGGPGNAMKLVADDVETVVLAGSGHWVAEQAPEALLEALTAFLAPYRDDRPEPSGPRSGFGRCRVRTSADALARRSDRVAQLRATRPRRAARPRRPRELLDADVHQLAAPEPYVRAWSQAYRDDGLVVIGVHTPEFSFEHEIDRVRQATKERGDRLPGRGRQRLRDLERLRQPLLAGALLRRRGRHHPRPPLRRGALRAIGARHPASCSASSASSSPSKGSASRRRPTGTTCAHPRPISATGAASTSRHRTAPRSTNAAPTSSPSGCASTTGLSPASGRSGRESVVLDQAGGSIAFRFHARDAHLVLSPGAREPIPFRVLLDGEAPGPRTASTSTRTGTACSATAACTSSCASTTRSASGRWRSRSSSPAPRRTCSRSGSRRTRRPTSPGSRSTVESAKREAGRGAGDRPACS